MSAIVKTITPFINKALLLEALTRVGCNYTESNGEILTERKDYFGYQKFVWSGGKYALVHDSDEYYLLRNRANSSYKTVGNFLLEVEKQYNICHEELLLRLEEEEKRRIEEERKAFVESQKQAIISKAKEKGYSIKEENIKGKIKLVLVRNTY